MRHLHAGGVGASEPLEERFSEGGDAEFIC